MENKTVSENINEILGQEEKTTMYVPEFKSLPKKLNRSGKFNLKRIKERLEWQQQGTLTITN